MEASPYPANVEALGPGSGQIESFQWTKEDLIFFVVAMRESVLLYVGRAEGASLSNVSVAMGDAATDVAGVSEEGKRIARQLQKRAGDKLRVVMAAYNASTEQAAVAQRCIVEELVKRKIL